MQLNYCFYRRKGFENDLTPLLLSEEKRDKETGSVTEMGLFSSKLFFHYFVFWRKLSSSLRTLTNENLLIQSHQ